MSKVLVTTGRTCLVIALALLVSSVGAPLADCSVENRVDVIKSEMQDKRTFDVRVVCATYKFV